MVEGPRRLCRSLFLPAFLILRHCHPRKLLTRRFSVAAFCAYITGRTLGVGRLVNARLSVRGGAGAQSREEELQLRDQYEYQISLPTLAVPAQGDISGGWRVLRRCLFSEVQVNSTAVEGREGGTSGKVHGCSSQKGKVYKPVGIPSSQLTRLSAPFDFIASANSPTLTIEHVCQFSLGLF